MTQKLRKKDIVQFCPQGFPGIIDQNDQKWTFMAFMGSRKYCIKYIMIFHDISWLSMIYLDYPWYIKIIHDISRLSIIYHDFPWYIMIIQYPWYILIFHDISWLLSMIYLDFPWYILIKREKQNFAGPKHKLIVYHDPAVHIRGFHYNYPPFLAILRNMKGQSCIVHYQNLPTNEINRLFLHQTINIDVFCW